MRRRRCKLTVSSTCESSPPSLTSCSVHAVTELHSLAGNISNWHLLYSRTSEGLSCLAHSFGCWSCNRLGCSYLSFPRLSWESNEGCLDSDYSGSWPIHFVAGYELFLSAPSSCSGFNDYSFPKPSQLGWSWGWTAWNSEGAGWCSLGSSRMYLGWSAGHLFLFRTVRLKRSGSRFLVHSELCTFGVSLRICQRSEMDLNCHTCFGWRYSDSADMISALTAFGHSSLGSFLARCLSNTLDFLTGLAPKTPRFPSRSCCSRSARSGSKSTHWADRFSFCLSFSILIGLTGFADNWDLAFSSATEASALVFVADRIRSAAPLCPEHVAWPASFTFGVFFAADESTESDIAFDSHHRVKGWNFDSFGKSRRNHSRYSEENYSSCSCPQGRSTLSLRLLLACWGMGLVCSFNTAEGWLQSCCWTSGVRSRNWGSAWYCSVANHSS